MIYLYTQRPRAQRLLYAHKSQYSRYLFYLIHDQRDSQARFITRILVPSNAIQTTDIQTSHVIIYRLKCVLRNRLLNTCPLLSCTTTGWPKKKYSSLI